MRGAPGARPYVYLLRAPPPRSRPPRSTGQSQAPEAAAAPHIHELRGWACFGPASFRALAPGAVIGGDAHGPQSPTRGRGAWQARGEAELTHFRVPASRSRAGNKAGLGPVMPRARA